MKALRPASLAGAADKPKECIYIDRDERMLRLGLPVVTTDNTTPGCFGAALGMFMPGSMLQNSSGQ